MSDSNGDSENSNLQRLNRMEDVIQSMITLVLEQSKAFSKSSSELLDVIKESRAELQDLIVLQKEQRIERMAPFAANKNLHETSQKYFDKH